MADSFEYCCNNPNTIDYEIKHHPAPIALADDLEETLKRLLWYAPEIKSKQSEKNDLIYEELYSTFVFNCFMEYMGLTDKDVLWLKYEDSSYQYYEYYKTKICVNCQKLILKKYDNESKMRCLLRHLRNSLAHGNFNVYGDLLIGFDEDKNEADAIIKVNLSSLREALTRTTSGITRERLIKKALQKSGYRIIEEQPQISNNTRFLDDVVAKKNGNTFLIEVKEYPGNRYISFEFVQKIRDQFRKRPRKPGVYHVLFIDAACLNAVSRQMLYQDRIYVLDKRRIKEMFAGNDVLAGIVR